MYSGLLAEVVQTMMFPFIIMGATRPVHHGPAAAVTGRRARRWGSLKADRS